jgi:hypothetical protein
MANAKPPRSDFALPGGKFPLNTPGRVKAAPGLAGYSESKGNITPAQEAEVKRKAAQKARGEGSPADAKQDSAMMKRTGMSKPKIEKSPMDKMADDRRMSGRRTMKETLAGM